MKKKSFIDLACEKEGVSRSTYYRASKKHKEGQKMSVQEISVLTTYHSLVTKARAKLVLINPDQDGKTTAIV